jgi:hypothetical protein|tara:strand:+ start:139 stop:942 length:804 start_codon:yes stop_codon:yes gene_type:complete
MINSIHTACKDCSFAVYKNGTQEGCEFNRIELYKESGAEVIPVYDDESNNFYVINNRICIYHRDKKWVDKYPKSEIKNIVEAQTKSPYHAILIRNEDKTVEDINRTIESLANQFNPPTVVSVINMDIAGSNYEFSMQMEEILKEHDEKFSWRVQNIVNSDRTLRECIDLAIDATYFSKSYAFYIVFEAGFVVPDNFTRELHDAFSVNQIVFASPVDNLNGLLCNKLLHRKHTGNAFYINIEDKLKEFEQGIEKHLFQIEELCPSLKQ